MRSMQQRHRGEATQPPMPTDPNVCRWCNGAKRKIAPAEGLLPAIVMCSMGCANNDEAPYLGDCDECGRPFQTGARRPTLCYECDRKEAAAAAASYKADAATGSYNFRRIGRGGYRA